MQEEATVEPNNFSTTVFGNLLKKKAQITN